jgi:hypothetical protein
MKDLEAAGFNHKYSFFTPATSMFTHNVECMQGSDKECISI